MDELEAGEPGWLRAEEHWCQRAPGVWQAAAGGRGKAEGPMASSSSSPGYRPVHEDSKLPGGTLVP